MKYVIPSCLAASGSDRAKQMPTSARVAIDVHTFWPSSTHPPSVRVARVDKRREVAARSGLGEELAPPQLAAQRGTHPPLLLLFGAVGDDRRQRPRPHRQARTVQAGGRQLLVDHELLHRTGTATPRGGQCGARHAAIDHPAPALVSVLGRADVRHQVVDLLAQSGGRVRQLGGQVAAAAGQGGARRLDAKRCRSSQELADGQGTAEMDVGVVLPREAHAAQDLNGALGAFDVAIEGDAPRPRWPTAPPVRRHRRRRPGPRPMPMRSSAQPARACRRSRCLMAWNWPMGRPNWRRSMACWVATSRHQRAPPAHSAAAIVKRGVAHRRRGERRQLAKWRDNRTRQPDRGHAPGEVEAGDGLDHDIGGCAGRPGTTRPHPCRPRHRGPRDCAPLAYRPDVPGPGAPWRRRHRARAGSSL